MQAKQLTGRSDPDVNASPAPSRGMILDKLIKKIAGWRGRLFTYSSRLVLIKTCLASIPIYLLSFFKFLKWAVKLLES
jgi:hypothetical protein